MSSACNKLGICVMGETLRGYARKFNEFPNNNPIFRINKKGVKLDSHGGKMSQCYVDKKIRETKLPDKSQVIDNIKVIIEEKYKEKVSIFEEREDYIEGNLIICECQSCELSKKKISHYSKSHSAGAGLFHSICAIAYLDLIFSPTKSYKLVE